MDGVMIKKYGKTRVDKFGFEWVENLFESTKYPNGMFNNVILENSLGGKIRLRYNEEGMLIAGNPAFS